MSPDHNGKRKEISQRKFTQVGCVLTTCMTKLPEDIDHSADEYSNDDQQNRDGEATNEDCSSNEEGREAIKKHGDN